MTREADTALFLDLARAFGFPLAGVAPAEATLDQEEPFARWIAKGCHGCMDYLAASHGLRHDPSKLLDGLSSVLVVAVPGARPHTTLPDGHGAIAAYGHGKDYHRPIKKALISLAKELAARFPGSRHRAFVDTGPVMERTLAQAAGLGFIGRNRCLVTPQAGSYVFLGVLLTTLELTPAAPPTTTQPHPCGSCTACIDACPTGALTKDGLDARRCISYLTMVHSGVIGPELWDAVGHRLLGCDACQQACPHNRRTLLEPAAFSTGGRTSLSLAEVLAWETDEQARPTLAGTALKYAGRDRLVRNAAIIAYTRHPGRYTAWVQRLADHDASPLVRSQAADLLQR